MRAKRWICLLMILAIVLALPTGAMAAKKKKASVKLPTKVGVLFIGDEIQLKPKLKGVSRDSLKYATSAEGIVTVSETGLVKGVAMGRVGVAVSSGSVGAKCVVLTYPRTITLKKGEGLKLPTASKVKFKMKNKKIARVSSKGMVKGVKVGKTKLAVKYGKQTRTIAVTVTADTAQADAKQADTAQSKAAQLEAASQTDQIVLVEYKSGSKATLSAHEKQNGRWVQLLETTAYVGKNGIDKAKEGDKRTPTGTFNLTTPFGIKADPGAKMAYTKVTKYHYWCGTSSSKYYNKLVDSRVSGRNYTKSDEHLIDYKGYYNYALFIDYNAEGVAGKGSCIFLHCTGGKTSTAGCVAISEANMKRIVQWAKSGAKIVIKKA